MTVLLNVGDSLLKLDHWDIVMTCQFINIGLASAIFVANRIDVQRSEV